jgi:hypothetical protein
MKAPVTSLRLINSRVASYTSAEWQELLARASQACADHHCRDWQGVRRYVGHGLAIDCSVCAEPVYELVPADA